MSVLLQIVTIAYRSLEAGVKNNRTLFYMFIAHVELYKANSQIHAFYTYFTETWSDLVTTDCITIAINQNYHNLSPIFTTFVNMRQICHNPCSYSLFPFSCIQWKPRASLLQERVSVKAHVIQLGYVWLNTLDKISCPLLCT